jgi:hypothetical protein
MDRHHGKTSTGGVSRFAAFKKKEDRETPGPLYVLTVFPNYAAAFAASRKLFTLSWAFCTLAA